MDDDRVFIRSGGGTSRSVHNPRNPIGLALVTGWLLFAAPTTESPPAAPTRASASTPTP
ncbi:hypothetical protein [Streptomyces sp. cg35]|uniref:hypothetical protein n=1 Tax=Streptomyces sp. cg35 TaxID=3421650 RepID=UPI003D16F51F